VITQEETARRIEHMIGAAIVRDTEQTADILTGLGESLGPTGMYGVCCAVAEVGKGCLTMLYGDQAPKTAEDMWVFEEVEPGALADDAAGTFAMRFLVAYANGDRTTALALYNATLTGGGDHHVRSVCTLVSNVAGLARLALEQNA